MAVSTFFLRYGLIIPNKKGGGVPIARPSIFNDDSDSDSPKAPKPTGLTKAKKQDVINQQKVGTEFSIKCRFHL